MLLRLLKYILFAGLLVPSFALAASTHHYVCSDFVGFNANAVCSSGTVTFGSIAKGGFFDDGTIFNLNGTATWYISFTASGTGTGNYANSNGPNVYTYTTSIVDQPFSTVGDSNPDGLYVENGATTGVSTNFVGTIGDFCISDTLGACTGGGGGGSGTTTVATSTVTIIDNPTQDLFDAVFLFFISMFFIVWFFMNRFRLV